MYACKNKTFFLLCPIKPEGPAKKILQNVKNIQHCIAMPNLSTCSYGIFFLREKKSFVFPIRAKGKGANQS